MGYLTIKDFGQFEFEEKKSKFIGQIKRVQDENQAKEFLNKVKLENKEARHNVYSYIIGENSEIQRYSDDGEPQGTAGMPILEVIRKNNLSDVIVVVTRYFGGILLGTGGLARAYSKAALESIKQAEVLEKVRGCAINFKLDYELMGKVQYYCEKKNWSIENIIYSDIVEFTIFTETKEAELLISSINDITAGRCKTIISDESMYFKSKDKLYKL